MNRMPAPATDAPGDASEPEFTGAAVAAMKAIFPATASCRPTGRPHCTRSDDHSRAILVAHLDWPTQIAGSASRPAPASVRRPDRQVEDNAQRS